MSYYIYYYVDGGALQYYLNGNYYLVFKSDKWLYENKEFDMSFLYIETYVLVSFKVSFNSFRSESLSFFSFFFQNIFIILTIWIFY